MAGLTELDVRIKLQQVDNNYQHCLSNSGPKVWVMMISFVCYGLTFKEILTGESALNLSLKLLLQRHKIISANWKKVDSNNTCSLVEFWHSGAYMLCLGFVNFVNWPTDKVGKSWLSVNCNESTLPATSSHPPCITPSNHHWVLHRPAWRQQNSTIKTS